MFKKLLSKNLDSLFHYLDHLGSLILVVINKQNVIVDCNQGFLKMLNMASPPIGRSLLEFVNTDSLKSIPTPSPNEFVPLKIVFTGEGSFSCIITGYILGIDDDSLIIGEKSHITGNNLVSTISKLNNELTNLVRELHKKNDALKKANATIQELMNTDPLTGLWNRRFFMKALEKEFAFSTRHHTNLTLTMVDIDHFKIINDTYGHGIGDSVLIEMSNLFIKYSREEDTIARFGGEEFIFLLPHTSSNLAVHFAERLRKKIETNKFQKVHQPITVSLGISERISSDTIETLIKKTDDALYLAKREGRNRVATNFDS